MMMNSRRASMDMGLTGGTPGMVASFHSNNNHNNNHHHSFVGDGQAPISAQSSSSVWQQQHQQQHQLNTLCMMPQGGGGGSFPQGNNQMSMSANNNDTAAVDLMEPILPIPPVSFSEAVVSRRRTLAERRASAPEMCSSSMLGDQLRMAQQRQQQQRDFANRHNASMSFATSSDHGNHCSSTINTNGAFVPGLATGGGRGTGAMLPNQAAGCFAGAGTVMPPQQQQQQSLHPGMFLGGSQSLHTPTPLSSSIMSSDVMQDGSAHSFHSLGDSNGNAQRGRHCRDRNRFLLRAELNDRQMMLRTPTAQKQQQQPKLQAGTATAGPPPTLPASFLAFQKKKEMRPRPPGMQSFPIKLHQILNNVDEYQEYITWMPHGRSWRILKAKAFETIVLPKHFRSVRYASFMRQVNGWGFRRITEGPDLNAYFHPCFVKGMPELCEDMRRPQKGQNPLEWAQDYPDKNPDFYKIAKVAPLPPSPIPSPNQSSSSAKSPVVRTSSSSAAAGAATKTSDDKDKKDSEQHDHQDSSANEDASDESLHVVSERSERSTSRGSNANSKDSSNDNKSADEDKESDGDDNKDDDLDLSSPTPIKVRQPITVDGENDDDDEKEQMDEDGNHTPLPLQSLLLLGDMDDPTVASWGDDDDDDDDFFNASTPRQVHKHKRALILRDDVVEDGENDEDTVRLKPSLMGGDDFDDDDDFANGILSPPRKLKIPKRRGRGDGDDADTEPDQATQRQPTTTATTEPPHSIHSLSSIATITTTPLDLPTPSFSRLGGGGGGATTTTTTAPLLQHNSNLIAPSLSELSDGQPSLARSSPSSSLSSTTTSPLPLMASSSRGSSSCGGNSRSNSTGLSRADLSYLAYQNKLLMRQTKLLQNQQRKQQNQQQSTKRNGT